MTRRPLCLTAALLLGACHSSVRTDPIPTAGSHYLFAWAGDADKHDADFLAVIDVKPGSPTYATVVATLPVGAQGTRPHHTEYEMAADDILWANGFDAGRTFRFDLHDPRHPALASSFTDAGPFSHPHSYARLPNGHVLATFQVRADNHGATGGLVEFDATGRVIRSVDATTAVDSGVRPYSLAVVPSLDRLVTTATDMHGQQRTRAVQVWRLSDLKLLQTVLLPPGRRGDEQWLTAEPRVLADGKSVLVNTFTCGLFRLRGLDTDSVWGEWVHSSTWTGPPYCAVPLVVGRFWLQPSGPEHAVIVLDLSDPSRPREVNRLTLAAGEIPHWIALEPNGDRVVITGYGDIESRVLLARLDRATGALTIDSTFRVDFSREQWPHGATGRAIPHGAVFSRPAP